ncbi:aldo/keto reductase [Kitasatospora sp. NPDC097643]|uniref:aldo/keto reductase n=1 Tax=Kitasatospora sp. NPDC097643 TaxID=3157230 RepID=UPI003327C97A
MPAADPRPLGDRTVFPIGLGALPLSVEGRPPRAQALRTLHTALQAGATLIDTADSYGLGPDEIGHNEELVAAGLAAAPSLAAGVLVASKGGHYRPGDGSWAIDARPEQLRRACESSLRALGRDTIDLYQLHRPDPQVPYAESVGALRDLRQEGKIRMVGVSNVDLEQLQQARAVVEVVSVQNRFSPADQSSREVLTYCTEHGIAFLPWAPLGGLATGGRLPDRLAEVFGLVALRHRVSVQRVCLAWHLATSPVVVPIPGTTRPESVTDNVGAAELRLEPAELRLLDDAVHSAARTDGSAKDQGRHHDTDQHAGAHP